MPKKSRSDYIRAAVGYYLKNKSYVGERFRKSDIALLQNRREFMFQTMQVCDLERSDNFTYSNHTITNAQQIAEQFGKFTQFVESQSECIRQELRRFYAPMLCHLYIDLLRAREVKTAIEFLKKFAQLVAPIEIFDTSVGSTKINGCTSSEDGNSNVTQLRFINNIDENTEIDSELEYFMNLIQTLSTYTQLEAVENDEDLAQFRTSKYEIHTTANVSEILTKYLEKRGHVLILNLLHSWFQMHIVDNEQPKWTEDNIFFKSTIEDELEDENTTTKCHVKIKTEPNTKNNLKRPTSVGQPQIEIKTEEFEINESDGDNKKWPGRNVPMYLDTIRAAKEQVLKTQILFPRCIKIADKDRRLTSADLDKDECHMVAGFNSSEVQLWQLNQRTFQGRNIYEKTNDNLCRFEINNCNKEDEDLIEIDIEAHLSRRDDPVKRKYFEKKYADNSYNEYCGIKLHGHGLGVTDVRFSTHYPLLYSVSKDSTMRSWHAESYNCAAIYRGHKYPIWCFDESPWGVYVATGSRDLTARLWSTEREYPLITFTGHTQDVECISFHPNGNYIATGSADLSVRLWCTTSGKLMRVFTDCKQPVTSVAFSPDGKLIAAAGEELKVRIFDVAAGAQLSELKDHSASITSMAWSSNGRQLATSCRDGTLRIWDTKRLLSTHDNSGSNATSNSATSSSSSSSSSPTRLVGLNSNCQQLVKVFFGRNETVCCIGR